MGDDLKRLSLVFSGESTVGYLEEALPAPGPGQVLVRTISSAISPGTEKLVFEGSLPQEMAVDANLVSLPGSFRYPLKYGYSVVGRVIEAGREVDASWVGRLVFAFNPHESAFTAEAEAVLPLPDPIEPEDALFLPNLESAVGLVMDGRPLIGERIAVFGQGILGLLALCLLRKFPLTVIVTVDPDPFRRERSCELGATASLDPDSPDFLEEARRFLPAGADLAFEVSGYPAALNQAISLTGFAGRLVVGSWYGTRPAELDLGGHFHRSRIRLISSQVSTLAPEITGRWDRKRRYDLVWELLAEIRPSRWITHRIPFNNAGEAYRLLTDAQAQAVQVVLTYPEFD